MKSRIIPALLAITSLAHAADPTYHTTLDTHHTGDKWKIDNLYMGDTPVLRFHLRENGEAWTASTNYGARFWYGTDGLNSTSIVSATGTGTGQAYIDIATTGATFASNGTYTCGLTVTNTAQTYTKTWGDGKLVVKKSPGAGTASALTLTTPFPLAQYEFTGTFPNANLDADLQTLAAPTAWRLFYSDGSSVVQELALGTSNQVLQSTGASAAPAWGTVGVGDMTKAVYDSNDDGQVDAIDITLDTAPVLGGDLSTDGHDILIGVNGLDQSRRVGFQVNDGISTTTQYIDRTTADGIRINGRVPVYSESDPIWAAVSNTVTAGAAAGATALQEESDDLADVVARGATATNGIVVDLPGETYEGTPQYGTPDPLLFISPSTYFDNDLSYFFIAADWNNINTPWGLSTNTIFSVIGDGGAFMVTDGSWSPKLAINEDGDTQIDGTVNMLDNPITNISHIALNDGQSTVQGTNAFLNVVDSVNGTNAFRVGTIGTTNYYLLAE